MDALPKRKPNRLREYDYASAGGYFLTLCTVGMNCVFSHVDVGAACGRPPVVTLTALGKIVEQEIRRLDCVYDCVRVDHYVIMPNHVHLLLMIDAESGRHRGRPYSHCGGWRAAAGRTCAQSNSQSVQRRGDKTGRQAGLAKGISRPRYPR